ncbi:hypothetical protein BJ508DRAFT_309298 [Ascobolus immersus RN42]|uniref:Uncharacterized protein n=1 Tax=Ascobolus immersus RN42 TaxID=1160509 RepID=A0A3N4HWW3_ASCIM|nr:hypothetical protein BJ508DRAFT_309298 [Ascobolus immersus RN42]
MAVEFDEERQLVRGVTDVPDAQRLVVSAGPEPVDFGVEGGISVRGLQEGEGGAVARALGGPVMGSSSGGGVRAGWGHGVGRYRRGGRSLRTGARLEVEYWVSVGNFLNPFDFTKDRHPLLGKPQAPLSIHCLSKVSTPLERSLFITLFLDDYPFPNDDYETHEHYRFHDRIDEGRIPAICDLCLQVRYVVCFGKDENAEVKWTGKRRFCIENCKLGNCRMPDCERVAYEEGALKGGEKGSCDWFQREVNGRGYCNPGYEDMFATKVAVSEEILERKRNEQIQRIREHCRLKEAQKKMQGV